MKLPFRVGITRQFIALFVLTSVFPLILFGIFFFHDLNVKYQKHVEDLLRMGGTISWDLIRDGLDTLRYKTRQAGNFPIQRAFNEYLRTGNRAVLTRELRAYQEDAGVEMLRVYDTKGTMVAVSSPYQAAKPIVYVMREMALKGQVVSSITRYVRLPDHSLDLAYVSGVPIYDLNSPKKIVGALVSRYSMSRNFSARRVLEVMPMLEISLYAREQNGQLKQLTTTNPKLTSHPSPLLFQSSHIEKVMTGAEVSPVVRERYGSTMVHSMALPLRHFRGDIIGYLMLSYSDKGYDDLKCAQYAIIGQFLLIGLLGSLCAAFFFKRTFLDPVDQLASTSKQVAAGKLGLRVREGQIQPEIRDMMGNFNRMLDQLKEDDLLKSTFISSLTHDLRTPLFAQRRVLQTLLVSRGKNDSELTEIVEGLSRNNDHLLDMVGKMLEAYQYESGRIALQVEMLDLSVLVQECCKALAPLALPKRISLKNEIEPESIRLKADPLQLKRVFMNLLSNAVENIQEERDVIVSAVVLADSVMVKVADNGPGISPDMLPHIFQRYFTGHPTRQKIGSGLGLFICRMIVELHGGTITVSSQPGEGTSYTLLLPLVDTTMFELDSTNDNQ
jgi:signal transduction histidine kinase